MIMLYPYIVHFWNPPRRERINGFHECSIQHLQDKELSRVGNERNNEHVVFGDRCPRGKGILEEYVKIVLQTTIRL